MQKREIQVMIKVDEKLKTKREDFSHGLLYTKITRINRRKFYNG